MRCFCLLALFSLLTSGCIRTAVVKFWEPAAIDVSSLNQLAVLEFQGNEGKSIAATLSSQLWENEFYTIVDPAPLSRELQLASYEEGGIHDVNFHEFLAPARAQGIDGVVMGEVVEYQCQDQQVRRVGMAISSGGTPNRSGAGGIGGEFRENVVREGVVTISFRLIDVETGEIRAAHQVSHRYTGDSEVVAGKLPSQAEVLDGLTQKCLEEIVEMLAPHEATCRIQLATCDVWTRGRRDVKEGNRHAIEGDWELAEKQWQAAVDKEPRNHAALFNLAVAADHRHDYAAAEEFAMQALRLQHKTCYTSGLDTIRSHRGAAEKSEEQRDARAVTSMEEEWR